LADVTTQYFRIEIPVRSTDGCSCGTGFIATYAPLLKVALFSRKVISAGVYVPGVPNGKNTLYGVAAPAGISLLRKPEDVPRDEKIMRDALNAVAAALSV